jgi:hypothetical protein
MIGLKNEFIKTYQVDNYDYKNYLVYIKEDAATYEAYLQNKNYGIISLMFGTPNNYLSLEDFITIVNNNIEREIKLYQELHEDKESE